MERYTIEQRVKVIQAYYENGQEMATVNVQFSKKIIFSDEADFPLSEFVNKQNYRIWANDNPRVIAEKPMHPQRVTVWCGLRAGEKFDG